jgi:hypothetical protein
MRVIEERRGRLFAIDGATHASVATAARAELARCPRRQRGGISWWDASGVFEELAMGSTQAGRASTRTLLLLYAADLAFRLRWEIRPMLDQGRTVVAAPYVDTAVAFGRAAGIPADWLRDLFQFAPPADASLTAPRRGRRSTVRGFIEFGCEHLAEGGQRRRAKQMSTRIERLLNTVREPKSRRQG